MSKIAVVTGTSKGIGRAIVDLLLVNEWQVFGISRSDPLLSHPQFTWVEFDLMHINEFSELSKRFPDQIDLLVNNAGISYTVDIVNILPLDFDKQFTINLKSPVFLSKELLPKLKQGQIINISSLGSKSAFVGFGIYSATKAGLDIFGRILMKETSVPVFTVLPDVVDTPLVHSIYGDTLDYTEILKPSDIADVVLEITQGKYAAGSEIIITNNALLEEDVSEVLNYKPIIVNIDES